MPIIYDATKLLLTVLLSRLCQWQVENKVTIPQGPLIIVANHVSWADIPLLGVVIPRRIAFMAKEELFHFPLSLICSSLGAFPVQRRRLDRKALRKASESLKNGWALGMFPEGTRSLDAQLQPAYSGTAFIALRNDALILPVGIIGTEKIGEKMGKTLLNNILHRTRITVNMGEPFRLPSGELNHTRLAQSTEFIMRRIAELLPESYQGAYKEEEHGD